MEQFGTWQIPRECVKDRLKILSAHSNRSADCAKWMMRKRVSREWKKLCIAAHLDDSRYGASFVISLICVSGGLGMRNAVAK